MSAFSPPKQTTWKGIDEIKAVRQTNLSREVIKLHIANDYRRHSTA
jgi:hypothetical protein